MTAAGTIAAVVSDLTLTFIPPPGAGDVKVTVPTEVPPPLIADGATDKDAKVGGETVIEIPIADESYDAVSRT